MRTPSLQIDQPVAEWIFIKARAFEPALRELEAKYTKRSTIDGKKAVILLEKDIKALTAKLTCNGDSPVHKVTPTQPPLSRVPHPTHLPPNHILTESGNAHVHFYSVGVVSVTSDMNPAHKTCTSLSVAN
jgi:hypothetical protein